MLVEYCLPLPPYGLLIGFIPLPGAARSNVKENCKPNQTVYQTYELGLGPK